MIKPRVDKLLGHADSHYAAVVVAAKRARQINSYFHNLGEGSFGEYPPPMVETHSEKNYLSMALEELAKSKLKYEYRAYRGRDALRRRRLIRGHRRRAGPRLRVRSRPTARFVPRRSAARARPDRPPRARGQLRRLHGRPRLGEHVGEAGRGGGRLDAYHLLPRLRRAAP